MRTMTTFVCARAAVCPSPLRVEKDYLIALLCILVLCIVCATAGASTYQLIPSDADLGDLDHTRYYTWGMNRPWKSPEAATSATLSFSKIYNWDNNSNVLYIHLLDTAPLGVKTYTDNQGGGDNFAGQGIVLVVYRNLTTTPHNLSYNFTQDQITMLNTYAADGRFALGFDPDCHYYNCGIKLSITSDIPVPEPSTVFLALSTVPALLFRRRA